MLHRVNILRGLLATGLGLAGAGWLGAQSAVRSPFLPAQSAGNAAPTAGAPLEFRGAMDTGDGLKLRIVDPSRRAGAWLRVNERDPGFDFVVKAYDAEHDTVTVDYQGHSITLAQHVAKVAAVGAPMAPGGAPGPAGNMPAAITQSVVVNPTPADEQRRLDAVAAEVARRRALREQAAQQANAGGPPPLQPQPQAQLQTGPTPANGGQRQPRPRGSQP